MARTMIVKRCFFPSHGRIQRRVNARKARGQVFAGSIWSFWWGPFCAFLVYDVEGADEATDGLEELAVVPVAALNAENAPPLASGAVRDGAERR